MPLGEEVQHRVVVPRFGTLENPLHAGTDEVGEQAVAATWRPDLSHLIFTGKGCTPKQILNLENLRNSCQHLLQQLVQ